MQSIGGVLSQRKLQTSDVSIETVAGNDLTNNTSIELPAEIQALITGSDYWVRAKSNRYKKLIREGHLRKLLHLAQLAHSKQNAANWFAAACSKARWEEYTLPYFAKLHEVARKADTVARRLGISVSRFIYKQVWKGVQVERWAIQAAEVSHEKPGQSCLKHFAWLCLHERMVLANMAQL